MLGMKKTKYEVLPRILVIVLLSLHKDNDTSQVREQKNVTAFTFSLFLAPGTCCFLKEKPCIDNESRANSPGK